MGGNKAFDIFGRRNAFSYLRKNCACSIGFQLIWFAKSLAVVGQKAKRLIFWVGEKTAFCAWFAKRLRFLAGLLVRAAERQKLLAGEVKSIGRS